MSSDVPQAYHVLSSAGVSAFLTTQGMFLTLQYLECALIKFLWLATPHVLRRNGDPTVEIFPTHERENSRCYFNLGINTHLNQFAQITFAFKSSCTHTLNLPIFLTHLCLFKSLSENTFLILVSFFQTFQISFTFLSLCLSSFTSSFQLSLASLNFSQGWVDSRVWQSPRKGWKNLWLTTGFHPTWA